MRHLTVRGVPPELARALEIEKKRRGTSLNQTVLDLLRQSLGVNGWGPRSNGLARISGTWSDAEHEAFVEAMAITEQIDEDLWR